MFNRFGRSRPTPFGSNGSQPQTGQPSTNAAQYKPDFLHPSGATNAPKQTGPTRPQRIKPDAFSALTPQGQRAALHEQARQQLSRASQLSYEQLRDPSLALPGGLSERQRADFKMLQRTDPMAAHMQLMDYHRTSDIRYNKPTPAPQPSSGPVNRRPPANFNGPRPHFGP